MGGSGEMARPLEAIGQRMIVHTRTSATNRLPPNTYEFACRILPLPTFGCDCDLELNERSFRPQTATGQAI